MTRYERLRRVLILCHHCLTNIAYYRGGRSGRKAAYDTGSNFWLTVSGNFLDAAVLAWCKLFASKERQSWRRIVPAASHNAFEAELLKAVGMTAAEWADYIDVMRTYRDKFLAHLDSDNIMNIPELDGRRQHALLCGVSFGQRGRSSRIVGRRCELPGPL